MLGSSLRLTDIWKEIFLIGSPKIRFINSTTFQILTFFALYTKSFIFDEIGFCDYETNSRNVTLKVLSVLCSLYARYGLLIGWR
jgi:hypothetical protein